MSQQDGCSRAARSLVDVLWEPAEAEDRTWLQAHLDRCAACRELRADLLGLGELASRLEPREPWLADEPALGAGLSSASLLSLGSAAFTLAVLGGLGALRGASAATLLSSLLLWCLAFAVLIFRPPQRGPDASSSPLGAVVIGALAVSLGLGVFGWRGLGAQPWLVLPLLVAVGAVPCFAGAGLVLGARAGGLVLAPILRAALGHGGLLWGGLALVIAPLPAAVAGLASSGLALLSGLAGWMLGLGTRAILSPAR